jgi:putative addiction module component (TIGR02574 family)
MIDRDQIVTTVRGLPPAERLELLRDLAGTLDDEECFWLDPAWQPELERRSQELDADPSIAVPWETVRQELREIGENALDH